MGFFAKLFGRREKSEREKLTERASQYEIPRRLRGLEALETAEYSRFKREEFESRQPRTLFEKLAKKAEILNIEPDEKTATKMQQQIDFCHMRVTPKGVASLTIAVTLILFLITLLVSIASLLYPTIASAIGVSLTEAGAGELPTGYIMLIWFIGLPIIWYIYNYPEHEQKRYIVAAGSEIVLFILYMVVYMRNKPNVEGAVKFASSNLSGPLSYDINKLMWDVEVGTYKNMDEALIEYANKWSTINKEFVESIQLIRTSKETSEERRANMLDEAVSIILEGTEERARIYNQELKMPVMLVHALGILLPVMGLVMFPVVMLFLEEVVSPLALAVIYDILLPFSLFFIIKEILERRPVTFSPPDISNHPRLPPPGRFTTTVGLRNYSLPAWPFFFIVAIPMILFGLVLMSYLSSISLEQTGIEPTLLPSLIIILGIGGGVSAYYILRSYQKLNLRQELRNIEDEFTEALFQLGNRMSTGIPIEQAIERSVKSLGNMSIAKLYSKILENIRRFGMNFRDAIFDPRFGAIREYPSRKIGSIMKVVTDASERGVQVAAIAMLQISRYLRGVHKTQQDVTSLLEDVLSSMKFQAYVLTPLVGGVIVTMATFIIRILRSLALRMQALQGTGAETAIGFLKAPSQMMSPGAFQIVVGIYVIETIILLAGFINGIENGEDPIGYEDTAGKTLLIGMLVYILSMVVTLILFIPMTQGLGL